MFVAFFLFSGHWTGNRCSQCPQISGVVPEPETQLFFQSDCHVGDGMIEVYVVITCDNPNM